MFVSNNNGPDGLQNLPSIEVLFAQVAPIDNVEPVELDAFAGPPANDLGQTIGIGGVDDYDPCIGDGPVGHPDLQQLRISNCLALSVAR